MAVEARAPDGDELQDSAASRVGLPAFTATVLPPLFGRQLSGAVLLGCSTIDCTGPPVCRLRKGNLSHPCGAVFPDPLGVGAAEQAALEVEIEAAKVARSGEEVPRR